MQVIQFRDYFKARLSYLQTQGITEPRSQLEKLSFTELRKLLSETDKKAEILMPDYWQKMFNWYQNWGKENTGKENHTLILEPREWNQRAPEERAKGTIQMLERYFAGEMIREPR